MLLALVLRLVQKAIVVLIVTTFFSLWTTQNCSRNWLNDMHLHNLHSIDRLRLRYGKSPKSIRKWKWLFTKDVARPQKSNLALLMAMFLRLACTRSTFKAGLW